MAADFGSDLAATDDLDANAREVEGDELVAQAIYRRLTTPRGQLLDDPDYGLDIRSFLQASMTAADLALIGGRIRAELAKDETIDDVQATVKLTAAQTITVDLAVTTGQGPFRMVFAVTAETVTRILGDA